MSFLFFLILFYFFLMKSNTLILWLRIDTVSPKFSLALATSFVYWFVRYRKYMWFFKYSEAFRYFTIYFWYFSLYLLLMVDIVISQIRIRQRERERESRKKSKVIKIWKSNYTVFNKHTTAHNWQKCKSTCLTCHCHEIYWVEAIGLSNSNNFLCFENYDIHE